MGGSYSYSHEGLDSGENAITNTVSRYQVSDILHVYHKLEAGRMTCDTLVDSKTFSFLLPFGGQINNSITQLFDYDDSGMLHWSHCLAGLLLNVQGSTSTKVQMLLFLHGIQQDSVTRSTLSEILTEAFIAADRICQAGYMNTKGEILQDAVAGSWLSENVFLNIKALVYDIISEIFRDKEKVDVDALLDQTNTYADMSWTMLYSRNKIESTAKVSTVYPSTYTYTWNSATPHCTKDVPSARTKHATCVHGTSIYVHGGKDGTVPLRDLWKYELGSSSWQVVETTGDAPMFLQEHTMLAYKRRLYVFGGSFSSSDETPLWILDLNTLKWRKFTVDSEVCTPCGRRGHTAVVSHNAMHIHGGYVDLKGSNGDLWSFDFETESWHLSYSERGDQGPGPRHQHSAVVHDGSMWIFGGMMDLQPKNDLWQWNFAVQTWQRIKSKSGPLELSGHTAAKVPNGMLIFGGEHQGALLNEMWKFQFSTQNWQKIQLHHSCVPPPRTGHSTIVIPHFQLMAAVHENIADRSISVPHLKQTLTAKILPRPYSSPPAPDCGNSDRTGHVFKNRISPVVSPTDTTAALTISQGSTFPTAEYDRSGRQSKSTISDVTKTSQRLRYTSDQNDIKVLKIEHGRAESESVTTESDICAMDEGSDLMDSSTSYIGEMRSPATETLYPSGMLNEASSISTTCASPSMLPMDSELSLERVPLLKNFLQKSRTQSSLMSSGHGVDNPNFLPDTKGEFVRIGNKEWSGRRCRSAVLFGDASECHHTQKVHSGDIWDVHEINGKGNDEWDNRTKRCRLDYSEPIKLHTLQRQRSLSADNIRHSPWLPEDFCMTDVSGKAKQTERQFSDDFVTDYPQMNATLRSSQTDILDVCIPGFVLGDSPKHRVKQPVITNITTIGSPRHIGDSRIGDDDGSNSLSSVELSYSPADAASKSAKSSSSVSSNDRLHPQWGLTHMHNNIPAEAVNYLKKSVTTPCEPSGLIELQDLNHNRDLCLDVPMETTQTAKGKQLMHYGDHVEMEIRNPVFQHSLSESPTLSEPIGSSSNNSRYATFPAENDRIHTPASMLFLGSLADSGKRLIGNKQSNKMDHIEMETMRDSPTTSRRRQRDNSIIKAVPYHQVDQLCMFILGGKEAGPPNLCRKPLSMWKCEIKIGNVTTKRTS